MTARKILLVDDEDYIVKLLKIFLKEAGYEVITASDGADALKKAKAQIPHLIVMDYLMEGLSGLDTVRKLKSQKETAHIPILILTGQPMNQVGKEFHDAGAEELITKPILPDKLVEKIQKYI